MPMLEIPVIPVVIPFVQITHMSDGIGMQSGECLLNSFILLTKDLTCGDGIDEQLADDGKVGSAAIAGHAVIAFVCLVFVFGRGAGGRDQFSWLLRIIDEPVEAELRCPFHQRIGYRTQIVFILRKLITLPERIHKPGTTHVPVCPLRPFAFFSHGVGHRPDVAVMTGAPAFIDAVVVAGSIASVLGKAGNEFVEWFSHLGHIRHKGRPVVFFQIDVHRVVAAPGRPEVG